MNFTGKVAISTGAASGMGLLFAENFAALGGNVVMCDVNEAVLAEKVAEAEAALKAGTLKVFDVTTFTAPATDNGSYAVDAEGHLTSAFATDTNGDWVADANEVVMDGYFSESSVQSAPYFAIIIDGITAVVE